jgi:hypothetical protein
LTPTGTSYSTAGVVPADETETFFANLETLHPRVAAYWHSTMRPAWRAANSSVNHWIEQQRAAGKNVARARDRLNGLVAVMQRAQFAAETGYAGFGHPGNAMEEQVRALQELRAHLAGPDYRGAEEPIRALDALEATMRKKMMDEGIYE